MIQVSTVSIMTATKATTMRTAVMKIAAIQYPAHFGYEITPYQLRAMFLQLPRATLPAEQLVNGHKREITVLRIPLAPIIRTATKTNMTHDHVGRFDVP